MQYYLNFENDTQTIDFNKLLIKFIDQALEEDIGPGDLTSDAVLGSSSSSMAYILVKENAVLAGIELAKIIFERIDPSIVFSSIASDGSMVSTGTKVATLNGPIHSLLKGERLVLNCLQRMSGIATKTRIFADKAFGAGVTILDTRKTTPNFRICEKWAVSIGGAKNHRYALYDQILIKDNHIKFVGGIKQALDNLVSYLSSIEKSIPVVVEVKNEEEFALAIQYDAVTRILMDNFKPDEITSIVRRYSFSQKLEASGGINQENFESYLHSGIHYLSIGDLTHHVDAVDISLKID